MYMQQGKKYGDSFAENAEKTTNNCQDKFLKKVYY